ncbi:competence/damage-inducible protein A [Algihabitans albus]|uniref:competence/damage-inducible protein A n=1 Tax=Algihabitans albus TaxID=2164067 RepID=UPI000E5C5825|nr:molybdopterin-binding protein [Algihabitans albus]
MSDTTVPESGSRVVTAALLLIGNEILSGRTRDANLTYIATRCTELGIRLVEARVVADSEAAVVEAVNSLRARVDYLFTTGGIGPTHDDITADCVAKAVGRPLIEHPEARALLEAHYGDQINPARLRMARTPEGAELIENPVSTAPGFRTGNVYVLAGIPKIMQAMFESLAPDLVGGAPLLSRALEVDLPESVIAGVLTEAQAAFADAVDIGSYPFARGGGFGVSVVLRGTDGETLARSLATVAAGLRDLGGTVEERT